MPPPLEAVLSDRVLLLTVSVMPPPNFEAVLSDRVLLLTQCRGAFQQCAFEQCASGPGL
jgi:hypothetical protein